MGPGFESLIVHQNYEEDISEVSFLVPLIKSLLMGYPANTKDEDLWGEEKPTKSEEVLRIAKPPN